MFAKIVVLLIVLSSAAAQLGPRKLYRDNDEEIIPRTDPFDNKDYRLPNNTIPLHYDIWLSTDVHLGVTDFTGRVTIQIQALENTSNITLHYREITILNVDLMNEAGSLIQLNVPFTHQEDLEFLIITPDLPLNLGQILTVEITYIGTLRNDGKGFCRSTYENSEGRTVSIASTKFESTDARHGFPWYDEASLLYT